MSRVRDWCQRCQRRREFKVRVRKSTGHKQRDCVACSRRRGRKRDPIRVTYNCMVQRVTNPNAVNYKYYGGMGVTIHPSWLGPGGFQQFMLDVGPRPAGRTLDRIDPEGNYEPGNVRWATPKEQVENRRPDGGVDYRHLTYVRKKKNYDQVREDAYENEGTK